jgi:hypothetical protein
MKVLPERETLWSWLTSSAALVWTAFELPVEESRAPNPPTPPTPRKLEQLNHHDSALEETTRLTGTTSKGMEILKDDVLPDLQLVDDSLN